MNTLSWFLYFAEVVHNFQGTAMFLIVTGCITFVVGNFIRALTTGIVNDDQKYKPREDRDPPIEQKVILKKLLFFTIVLMGVSIFIPSKQTLYLIAASEMSEVVITDDRTQRIFDKVAEKIESELDVLSVEKVEKVD